MHQSHYNCIIGVTLHKKTAVLTAGQENLRSKETVLNFMNTSFIRTFPTKFTLSVKVMGWWHNNM